MAVIDSRQAGVLKQLGKEGGNAPENAVRKWMADITGLPLHRVVRRWLPRPGTRPGIDEDWIAVGVERVQTHGTPYQRGRKGQPEDAESGDVVREVHQTLHCIASFYGPNAAQIVDDFRDAAQLFQTNDSLKAQGLTLQGIAEDALQLPDLLGEQWVPRFDITFKLGRKVTRTYGVRDLVKVGPIEIYTEKGKVNG